MDTNQQPATPPSVARIILVAIALTLLLLLMFIKDGETEEFVPCFFRIVLPTFFFYTISLRFFRHLPLNILRFFLFTSILAYNLLTAPPIHEVLISILISALITLLITILIRIENTRKNT